MISEIVQQWISRQLLQDCPWKWSWKIANLVMESHGKVLEFLLEGFVGILHISFDNNNSQSLLQMASDQRHFWSGQLQGWTRIAIDLIAGLLWTAPRSTSGVHISPNECTSGCQLWTLKSSQGTPTLLLQACHWVIHHSYTTRCCVHSQVSSSLLASMHPSLFIEFHIQIESKSKPLLSDYVRRSIL